MERLQRVSSFSIVASEAIHELQRERGRSAGYVGSKGSASYLKSLNAQRGRSDTALNKLESVIEEDLDLFKGHRKRVGRAHPETAKSVIKTEDASRRCNGAEI